MNTRFWWFAIIILLIVIGILAWLLWITPAPSRTVATSTAATSTATTSNTGTSTNTGASSTPVLNPILSTPKSGGTVDQTFTVSGEAPGNWYFEAVFPIEVRDASGTVIAHGQARAQGDWMTSAMVPFTSTISATGYTGSATLVLKKDNPSGLPQNDALIQIPITIQ